MACRPMTAALQPGPDDESSHLRGGDDAADGANRDTQFGGALGQLQGT
jgi:hypothetical protein